MDSDTFKTFLTSTVSVSDLTRSGAKKIFDSLKKDDLKIILKNNKPIAALVSTKRYQDLLEKEEDLRLLQLAVDRKASRTGYTSRTDFLKENGILEDDLRDLPDITLE